MNENKVRYYRINILNKTQKELAKVLGISRQSYNYKENRHIQFNDNEKTKFKNELQRHIPSIKVDDIFF